MRGSSIKFRISKGWWTNNNFHCNGQESKVRKVGNLFQRKKTHWNAKNISKTRKQHHKHGPTTSKSTVFTPILHNFQHNPRAHILYHRLWYFIQIPYLSNFEQHFSGSREFVQNEKHALYAQTASEADRSRLTT